MKWVYFAGGGLILLGAIVALIGAMLPRDHHATRQARFRQKPEAIYFTLAGPVDWRSDIKASGSLPDRDGRKQRWEQDSHGHKVAYELVEDQMPSRRVTRIAEKTCASAARGPSRSPPPPKAASCASPRMARSTT